MGLLDIVGGMLGGQQGGQAGAGGLGDLLGQLAAGGQGGQGGQAELLRMVLGMLANDGQGGGLAGLMQKFQAAGLGEQMNSWVGTGQNLPVSAEQLGSVLGPDQMGQMAERMGLSTGDLGTQLSQLLPQAVDQFTPGGQLPAGGLGDLGDLLGQLMRR
ncbi:MAG: YidB family protein [Burkholderiaceae bacterium]|jgi:uncharacterized protein YidB (DUF937 family)|nr:YidB family protein [Burkholderiaceae bacterium]